MDGSSLVGGCRLRCGDVGGLKVGRRHWREGVEAAVVGVVAVEVGAVTLMESIRHFLCLWSRSGVVRLVDVEELAP